MEKQAEIKNDVLDKSEIIKIAVEAAKEYDKRQRAKNNKWRRDWRLRNTRLLLRHYDRFRKHIANSVYSSTQLSAVDLLGEMEGKQDNIDINSIKHSAKKTYVIMCHVDAMLDLYKLWCDKEGETEQRKYRILEQFYLEHVKMPEILESEHISERTFYRYVDDAVDKLSALIFGIDAIEKMVQNE